MTLNATINADTPATITGIAFPPESRGLMGESVKLLKTIKGFKVKLLAKVGGNVGEK